MRGSEALTQTLRRGRNTAAMSRAVAPVRLSNAEREQIASAALRQGITFSAFLRQAALEASARVEGKVSPVKAPERETREQAKATILEPEPAPAVEEPWRPHHFVDGGCLGCGLDVDDVRGRDFPCEPAPGSICSAGALTRLDRVEAARAPPARRTGTTVPAATLTEPPPQQSRRGGGRREGDSVQGGGEPRGVEDEVHRRREYGRPNESRNEVNPRTSCAVGRPLTVTTISAPPSDEVGVRRSLPLATQSPARSMYRSRMEAAWSRMNPQRLQVSGSAWNPSGIPPTAGSSTGRSRNAHSLCPHEGQSRRAPALSTASPSRCRSRSGTSISSPFSGEGRIVLPKNCSTTF
jgi:hypothetical protein